MFKKTITLKIGHKEADLTPGPSGKIFHMPLLFHPDFLIHYRDVKVAGLAVRAGRGVMMVHVEYFCRSKIQGGAVDDSRW